ncbi:hypothetical protein VOLCADRAFT_104895 [Volvox carteri f. nagariensis]|uniref:Uncharacterized protein n=1 Tax=Volvox carteri f. nagariensis TaxID=3068 RepID=D8TWV5_VOLCA|nr:uncharacterized protein VOLCADRAFT_104895 [Volvox carteri f. nagariensis]EFJ48217.1 hypothetical protein VOLCADRAFT_104895 [Volvox carteri f. nagariensis]|eukprot:XP_002950902.1 hypothetical protein VOLCADRAFT_104895 [Volvox carteri f. nagariensis]
MLRQQSKQEYVQVRQTTPNASVWQVAMEALAAYSINSSRSNRFSPSSPQGIKSPAAAAEPMYARLSRPSQPSSLPPSAVPSPSPPHVSPVAASNGGSGAGDDDAAGGWQRLRPDFCSQSTQSTRVQIRLPAPRVFEE